MVGSGSADCSSGKGDPAKDADDKRRVSSDKHLLWWSAFHPQTDTGAQELLGCSALYGYSLQKVILFWHWYASVALLMQHSYKWFILYNCFFLFKKYGMKPTCSAIFLLLTLQPARRITVSVDELSGGCLSVCSLDRTSWRGSGSNRQIVSRNKRENFSSKQSKGTSYSCCSDFVVLLNAAKSYSSILGADLVLYLNMFKLYLKENPDLSCSSISLMSWKIVSANHICLNFLVLLVFKLLFYLF